MTSNTTRTTASSKKEEPGRTGFKGKEVLIDRMTPDDFQRALHNEYDMGCCSGSSGAVRAFAGDFDFDHHLF